MTSYESINEMTQEEQARRKSEILKKIAVDIGNGMSPTAALEKYRDEYIERTGTILTRIAVGMAFQWYGDKEAYARVQAERKAKALAMREKGMRISDIAEEIGISETNTRALLNDGKEKPKRVIKPADTFMLTQDMIDAFKDSLKVGDTLECKVSRTKLNPLGLLVTKSNDEDVVITSKYKNFCETNKGTFRWADLYLFRRARMLA